MNKKKIYQKMKKIFLHPQFGLYIMKIFCILAVILIALSVQFYQLGKNDHILLVRLAQQCLNSGVAVASTGFGAFICTNILQRRIRSDSKDKQDKP